MLISYYVIYLNSYHLVYNDGNKRHVVTKVRALPVDVELSNAADG